MTQAEKSDMLAELTQLRHEYDALPQWRQNNANDPQKLAEQVKRRAILPALLLETFLKAISTAQPLVPPDSADARMLADVAERFTSLYPTCCDHAGDALAQFDAYFPVVAPAIGRIESAPISPAKGTN